MDVSPTFRKSPLSALVLGIIILWGLHEATSFLVPVLLAALLAFLIAPVTRGLRKLKFSEWASVAVSAMLIVLPLAGLVFLMVSQIQALVQSWPVLSSSLLKLFEELRHSTFVTRLHLSSALNPDALRTLVQSHFGSGLLVALTSLEKILGAGTLLILVVFFAVAMVASRKHLESSFDHLLSSYTSIELEDTVNSVARMMESYLVARTAIAAGLGAVSFGLCVGFGVPYSLLLGAFLGLMTWVPIIGFVLGVAPVMIVGFASGISGGRMSVLLVLLGAAYAIQDHIITPKWVGHRLKLGFFATYLSFFAGGLLWGGWGMILSVPLIGAIRIICSSSPVLRPWAFALTEDDGGKAPGLREERPLHSEGNMALLEPGTLAPDFKLNSTPDQKVSLADFRGCNVALVFFPADWSPVCGDELAVFNEAVPHLRKHNIELMGISVDGPWCHMAFTKDRRLRFPLLSDFEPKGSVAKAFRAYREQEGICERAIYLIDREGVIRWSHLSPVGVNPGVDGLLDAAEALTLQKKAS